MAKKEQEQEVRKSVIKKTLQRTINTGAYESLVVSVSFEEEVDWVDVAERQDKSKKISALLQKDLKDSILSALQSLGLIESDGIEKKSNGDKNAVATKKDKVKVSIDSDGFDSI